MHIVEIYIRTCLCESKIKSNGNIISSKTCALHDIGLVFGATQARTEILVCLKFTEYFNFCVQ